MRLARLALIWVLSVIVLAGLVFSQSVSYAHNGKTHKFAQMSLAADVNETREAYGLDMLPLNRQLQKEADHYADELCSSGRLVHAEDITGDGRFHYYGENIGRSHRWQALGDAFENSPGHLANILEERFTSYGVGVCKRGAVWYVVYRFAGPIDS